ncbi:hypothetical protein ACROYT_G012084 [Oculina patagonica]
MKRVLLAFRKSLKGFVHKTFKDEQRVCIRRIVCERKDVLAVLPTGFGKSVIYHQWCRKYYITPPKTPDDRASDENYDLEMSDLSLTQNQPLQKTNFKNHPNSSFKKGNSNTCL